MNSNAKINYEIVEEIKTEITDNQYKIIMDNLMVLNGGKAEEKRCFFKAYTRSSMSFISIYIEY